MDVIVSEVRETSRKPDEIYNIIERLAPGKDHRRLELFGRNHNVRAGWLTLGNQLGDTCVYDEDIVNRLNQRCVRLACGANSESAMLRTHYVGLVRLSGIHKPL